MPARPANTKRVQKGVFIARMNFQADAIDAHVKKVAEGTRETDGGAGTVRIRPESAAKRRR